MNFPHLNDTQFPDIQTVDVYKFQNTFDYTRWTEKTRIKLCNVIWNSDYADVVKFDDNITRDTWFNSLDDTWTLELASSARIVPEGYVKLPIPYDVMARYNYIFIDIPIATSADAPLDYETADGFRRWYFFINDIVYLSPNTTQVYLVPDLWTNFQNDMEINYLLLERGHAPVAYSDTDEYLSNPLANNAYLLAPDVNFDKAAINRGGRMIPYGNGKKYVCMASTCAPNQISSLGVVTNNPEYDGTTGTISYSDVDARYGYQLQVNGLTIGNGRDYSNANTPASAGYSGDARIANNLAVYAIPAYECYGNGTFYADVVAQCPQFLNTVQGCFVVDETALTLGTEYLIAGHYVYACVGKNSMLQDNITFSKSDFAFPSEYQRFAKLYTSPYSVLEITDNDGNTYEVGVEETGTLSVQSMVSLAFPYINTRIFIGGIRGPRAPLPPYVWRDLANTERESLQYNSDWFKFCFEWEIPTFALYMDGETQYQLESFNRNVRNGIRQALVAYHNTMRSANTAYENAVDQSNVAYANTNDAALTARGNAYRSADTGKTNADNSADTQKTNTDASADTTHGIAYRDWQREWDNYFSNVTAYTNSETAAMQLENDLLLLNETLNLDNKTAANQNMISTVQATEERTIATTANSAFSSLFQSGISGATSGAMWGGGNPVGSLAGAAVGAGSAFLGGAIEATTAMSNVSVIMNADQAILNAQMNMNDVKVANENAYLSNVNTYRHNNRVALNGIKAIHDRAIIDHNKDTGEADADDVQTVTKANALRTQTTAKTNATNTKNTSRANAGDTYATTEANADRTRDNVQDNAGYTREVETLNAKELLENARATGMAGVLDARNSAPRAVCNYTGNPAPDYYMTRGVQMKIKTQSDSAIRQTGDIFARYGYALNQVWDVARTGLKLMRHFTYWKAQEIWVDNKSTNNNVATFMQNMFLKGVTVWNTPEEIGKVSVYDN